MDKNYQSEWASSTMKGLLGDLLTKLTIAISTALLILYHMFTNFVHGIEDYAGTEFEKVVDDFDGIPELYKSFGMITLVLGVVTLLAIVLKFFGINQFARIQWEEKTMFNIIKVRTGIIIHCVLFGILIINAFTGVLTGLGWTILIATWLMLLIGFVLQALGYHGLHHSAEMSERARKGARTLRRANNFMSLALLTLAGALVWGFAKVKEAIEYFSNAFLNFDVETLEQLNQMDQGALKSQFETLGLILAAAMLFIVFFVIVSFACTIWGWIRLHSAKNDLPAAEA